MENQSLLDFFKKNKVLCIGLAIVLGILIVDEYILKPLRKAKSQQKSGLAVDRSATQQTTSSNNTAVAQTSSNDLRKPDYLAEPSFPQLSSNIDDRFYTNMNYPYHKGRNVFTEQEKPVIVVEAVKEPVEEVIVRPDISYHGFFTMGNDKVAVLKKSDEVLLTKVGTKVRRTTFRLASITPEKVVMTDLSNKLRDFEISLAGETESN